MGSEYYAIVVNRGNLQAVVPVDAVTLEMLSPYAIVEAVAYVFMRMQMGSPAGKVDKPINPRSSQQLMLQYQNGDYVHAVTPVKYQFEGKWKPVEIPEQLRPAVFGNQREVPSIELELVDSPIIIMR